MSAVTLTQILVHNNPASFFSPFEFEISYECTRSLKDDLEWKITYVGSAEDEKYDQVLESVLVGPVDVGAFKFVLQADPPNQSLIPEADLLGVTVLLLTCSYKEAEFVRVGYYVNNEYSDEALREEPPSSVQIDKVVRSILEDKPRVTKFAIPWDPLAEGETAGEQEQEETPTQEGMVADEAEQQEAEQEAGPEFEEDEMEDDEEEESEEDDSGAEMEEDIGEEETEEDRSPGKGESERSDSEANNPSLADTEPSPSDGQQRPAKSPAASGGSEERGRPSAREEDAHWGGNGEPAGRDGSKTGGRRLHTPVPVSHSALVVGS